MPSLRKHESYPVIKKEISDSMLTLPAKERKRFLETIWHLATSTRRWMKNEDSRDTAGMIVLAAAELLRENHRQ